MNDQARAGEPLPLPLSLIALIVGIAAMLGMQVVAVLNGLGTRPAIIVAEASLAGPGLLLLALLGRSLGASLSLKSPGGRALGLSFLAGGALWGASLGLFEQQSVLWPPSREFLEMFERLHEDLRPSGVLDLLFSTAVIAVVPATCEEVLFRGVILPSVARPFGRAAGILVSAALFGLIHVMQLPSSREFSFYRVPFAFSVGIGLGLLRTTTGSLVPPIAGHATLNAITFLAAIPLLKEGLPEGPDPMAPFGLPMLVIGTGAFLFLLRKMKP
jgi:membrane protease YdiL (CAAX protease family)